MNAVFASGVQTYVAASAQLNRAADRVNTLRASTIPSAPSPGAEPPGAPPGPSTHPTTGGGGRASTSASVPEAVVDMIGALNSARTASTFIRAADEMSAMVLDMKA
jgi:hypothetical protein